MEVELPDDGNHRVAPCREYTERCVSGGWESDASMSSDTVASGDRSKGSRLDCSIIVLEEEEAAVVVAEEPGGIDDDEIGDDVRVSMDGMESSASSTSETARWLGYGEAHVALGSPAHPYGIKAARV